MNVPEANIAASRSTSHGAFGRERLRRYLLVSVPIAIAAIGVAIGTASLLARAATEQRETLRQLRLAEQRLERHTVRLAAPGAEAVLAALAESRDALRVRLVEALDGARLVEGVDTLRYRIDQQALPGSDESFALRLSLQGRLAHGAVFLRLLDTVHVAARPWPAETSGCRLHRVVDAGVRFDCTVDMLHWNELRAPFPIDS